MKVLLTGATGFIGSHIGKQLALAGHQIIGLKRNSSSLINTSGFSAVTEWVNQDELDWVYKVNAHKPEVIIHSAWIGVESSFRDDLKNQVKNIDLLVDLLGIAKQCQVTKFIGFGSQAEFGNVEGVINEQTPCDPVSSYGAVKVASRDLAKAFCKQNEITFIWLQLFSFFGEGESSNWLIPSMIRKVQEQESIDLTLGEQVYSYLYIDDFARKINKIILSNIQSDSFVISSDLTISIRSLVESIRDRVNSNCKLNFGALDYRPNQSFMIKGDSTKFESVFGKLRVTDFNLALENTIQYYIK